MPARAPRLIVNADDYGMTPGVNRSVEELFVSNAVSSASLMASGQHIEGAARFASQNPSLGIGCHVVLIDGAPVCDPGQVPTLLEPGTARFRSSMPSLMKELARGTIAAADIERETAAQVQRLRDYGVFVDHLDTHKHTHIFPPVLRGLLRGALATGVRAVRNPFEKHWSVRKTRHAGFARGLAFGTLYARFHAEFCRTVTDAGLATTSGTVGILATGKMTEKLLKLLLSSLPQGTWELICHPGYLDSELSATKTNLRASRAIEHAALLNAIPQSGIALTTFGDLTG